MESGARRGKGLTDTLRRRERLHWLLMIIAAYGQIEVPWLLTMAPPSVAPGTRWHYERYLDDLVKLDLVWVHKARGMRIASATTRGRRALARIQADNPGRPTVRAYRRRGSTGGLI